MARYSYSRQGGGKKNKKKGHFAALCLCMALLGAVSWFALDITGAVPKDNSETVSQNSSSQGGYIFETVSGLPGPSQESPSLEPSIPEVENDTPSQPEAPPQDPPEEELPAGAQATFFVMPVAGNVIKEYSPESPIYSETFQDFRVHSGVDISAAVSAPISSAGNGIVRAVRKDELLGNVVEIDHGNGIICFYSGLAEHILVEEGQTVEASQPIGTIGTVPTECIDAPHLHLEVLKNGEPASPMDVLGLN